MPFYFIDNLALTEALILFAATVLTYTGVMTWWAMRTNQPDKVQAALRGGALPVGAVGVTAIIMGLWSEMVWPYPQAMGGYNILFNDATVMFGIVMLAFAASAYLNLRLQYVGVLALVVGSVIIFYGWTGYGYHYTLDPLDTLLLYLGFGAAGIFALPATYLVDYYMVNVAKSDSSWRTTSPSFFGRRALGARAAQKMGLAPNEGSGTTAAVTPTTSLRYRMPIVLQALVLLFPVFMALAGIAAWWYLGTTVTGHLIPGKAP